jgi:hypothetical protein
LLRSKSPERWGNLQFSAVKKLVQRTLISPAAGPGRAAAWGLNHADLT